MDMKEFSNIWAFELARKRLTYPLIIRNDGFLGVEAVPSNSDFLVLGFCRE